jgi:hypothetical protein
MKSRFKTHENIFMRYNTDVKNASSDSTLLFFRKAKQALVYTMIARLALTK